MEYFEFADAPISLGELQLDVMECSVMLHIPFTELSFEPMNPSCCRLQFLDSRAKSIGIGTLRF